MSDKPLKNKVVVIIGGTAGIGRSAARACVAAGAQVVTVGRNAENVAATAADLGPSTHAIAGDATEPPSITSPAAAGAATETGRSTN